MMSQRDVCLVPFPFSDQSGNKVRPVVVISNTEFNQASEDVIVIGITSQLSKGKYTIPLSSSDIEQGTIHHDSYIKAENILKIDQKLILKKLGMLNQKKFDQTIQLLEEIIH